ncbi:acyl-CoA synthetase [Guyparkeria hydrothermalis]|uniref:LpxL/LpxP family acyltransferase n=1 Tax=Guyparkeria hydrothermalis TaxID=923 RepID=UPI00201FD747|nr:acyl-CoA synthetase [Guyparkeria hydrothermalis]
MSREHTAAAHWWTRRERGHPALLRLMAFVSLKAGRRVSRLLLAPISLYFLLFVPAARRASRDFLGRVHGRPARWGEVYRHFHDFASTIHDRLFFLSDRFEAFEVEVVGAECFDPPDPAILVGAHFGSFDVLRAMGRFERDLPISMMMYPENARKIQQVLEALNPERSQDIIPLGRIDSMLEAGTRLEQGHLVGMLADRSLEGDPMGTRPFLGQPARFAVGPFRMAAILRQRLLLMAGIYLGGNRYRIHFEPLADFRDLPRRNRSRAVDEAMDRYVDRLETLVRAYPGNWFNFYDFWGAEPGQEQPRDERETATTPPSQERP